MLAGPMDRGVREMRLGNYIEGLASWAVGPKRIGAMLQNILDVCEPAYS